MAVAYLSINVERVTAFLGSFILGVNVSYIYVLNGI